MSAEKTIVPRRSLLYMPGANRRALEKAQSIDCDTIIFDLEDAVAVNAKAQARAQVEAALGDYQYGYRELVVRCNGLETEWGMDDLRTFAAAPISALLFPKIESLEQISRIKKELAALGSTLPLWIMIETPGGGGYGPALDRDPANVLRDWRDEIISEATMRDVYGVVAAADGKSVDANATAALRCTMVAAE